MIYFCSSWHKYHIFRPICLNLNFEKNLNVIFMPLANVMSYIALQNTALCPNVSYGEPWRTSILYTYSPIFHTVVPYWCPLKQSQIVTILTNIYTTNQTAWPMIHHHLLLLYLLLPLSKYWSRESGNHHQFYSVPVVTIALTSNDSSALSGSLLWEPCSKQ